MTRKKTRQDDIATLRQRVRELEDQLEDLQVLSEDIALQAEKHAGEARMLDHEFETKIATMQLRQKLMEESHQTKSHDLGAEKRKLVKTNEKLRLTVEEAESKHEEFLISQQDSKVANEELKAANQNDQVSEKKLKALIDDKQVVNEELETVNEELRTVNDQLEENAKLLEISRNDVFNLLNSTDISILFLD